MVKQQQRETNRLRVLRAEMRWSQMETAERARIGFNRYWRIENEYAEPEPDERAALARVFGVTEADVWTSDDSTLPTR